MERNKAEDLGFEQIKESVRISREKERQTWVVNLFLCFNSALLPRFSLLVAKSCARQRRGAVF